MDDNVPNPFDFFSEDEIKELGVTLEDCQKYGELSALVGPYSFYKRFLSGDAEADKETARRFLEIIAERKEADLLFQKKVHTKKENISNEQVLAENYNNEKVDISTASKFELPQEMKDEYRDDYGVTVYYVPSEDSGERTRIIKTTSEGKNQSFERLRQYSAGDISFGELRPIDAERGTSSKSEVNAIRDIIDESNVSNPFQYSIGELMEFKENPSKALEEDEKLNSPDTVVTWVEKDKFLSEVPDELNKSKYSENVYANDLKNYNNGPKR